jgi:O-antigen/teichoic acid export membrane protein
MPDNSRLTLRANSYFVSLGAAIRLVVSLISIPLLVRFLGLERYGIWVVLNSVIAISSLMEFGLSAAFTNYLSIYYAQNDWFNVNCTVTTSFVLITFLGGVTSLGLSLASPILGHLLFVGDAHGTESLFALEVISWLLLLRFWQQWAMAAEAALFRYDVQATVETAGAVVINIGTMILAFVGGSLWILAAWSLTVTGGSLIFHYLALKRLSNGRFLRPGFSKKIFSSLIHFGTAQWLSGLGASLFGYGDRILVNLILGSEAAGLYSAATSIAIQINSLSAIPLRVLPPAISAAKALSQNSRIYQIFIRATKLNGLLVLLTAAPVLYWAPQLSYLLVGAEHAVITTEILRILAVAYGIYSLSVASYFFAIGVGYPILNARWGVIGAVFSLFLIAILTSFAGLKGSAWGNIGYSLTLIITYHIVRIIGLKYTVYLKLFVPYVVIIILWWLISEYGNIILLPIWAQILTFIFLVIISVLYIKGLSLIREFAEQSMSVYKKCFS